MTERVEDQEVIIPIPSILLLDPISWSLPERQKMEGSSFQEKRIRDIDCGFLQTPRKSMKKKGSNSTIHPSPQNERGDLVVLGLHALLGAPFYWTIEAEPKPVLER